MKLDDLYVAGMSAPQIAAEAQRLGLSEASLRPFLELIEGRPPVIYSDEYPADYQPEPRQYELSMAAFAEVISRFSRAARVRAGVLAGTPDPSAAWRKLFPGAFQDRQ